MKECVLCNGLKEKEEKSMYNYPLWETENFVVFADRLPVAKYHFIIVSRVHYINVWDVLRAGHGEELQEIVDYVHKCLLGAHADKVFMFEHGQSKEDSMKSGKSVEHFHLHIVANADTVLEILKEKHNKSWYFDSFAEMNKKDIFTTDYLLAGNLSEKKVWIFTMEEGVPSQYIRTILYKRMNDDLQQKMRMTGERGYDWKSSNNTITKSMLEEYYKVLNEREDK